jgi:hypothetical protein
LKSCKRQAKRLSDFSKGKQGKFCHSNLVLKLPIYFDDDLAAFLKEYARNKKADVQAAANGILRHNLEMPQALKA